MSEFLNEFNKFDDRFKLLEKLKRNDGNSINNLAERVTANEQTINGVKIEINVMENSVNQRFLEVKNDI